MDSGRAVLSISLKQFKMNSQKCLCKSLTMTLSSRSSI